MFKKFIFIFVILVIVLIFLSTKNLSFELVKNLEIFYSLVAEVERNYVDDIDVSELIRKSIDEMLLSLDPYTNFISEAQIEEFKLMTTSHYGGIGAIIQQTDTGIIITNLFFDSPAHKVGLKPGDIIVEVNNKKIKGLKIDEVRDLMKGSPNTKVKIKIFRPYYNKYLTFNLIRESIKIPCVPYYTIIDNNIGYIILTEFTENSYKEFLKAFKELKSKGITSLIIDLRNNPGGLLLEAVNIASIFFKRNTLITYTKGRQPEYNVNYLTIYEPLDTLIPIVFLVNKNSASASELLTGAFQDYDRAVLVGDTTFGKGLVQSTINLPFNSILKITTAKYYTPLGRPIHSKTYSDKLLLKTYKTKKGRSFHESKGLIPDIVLSLSDTASFIYSLIRKNLFFEYANKFYYENPTIDTANFIVDEKIFQGFKSFVDSFGFSYESNSEKTLNFLINSLKKENYYDNLCEELKNIELKIQKIKEIDWQLYKEQIKYLLTKEILSRYICEKAYFIYKDFFLNIDKQLDTSIKILKDINLYYKILSKK